MIEPESGIAASLQDCWNGRLVSGVLDSLIRSGHFLFITNNEAHVKKRRIACVRCILAMHQDQDEAVRSVENGEPAAATTLGNLELEAALEKFGKPRNILTVRFT
jgi:hypothetical protein